ILGDSLAEGPLLVAARECEELAFQPIPRGRIMSGVGAARRNPGAMAAADAIRERIGGMARDGTLNTIQLHWLSKPSEETLMLEYIQTSQRLNRILAAGCLVLGAAFCAGIWLFSRLRAAKLTAERATRVKSEFLA